MLVIPLSFYTVQFTIFTIFPFLKIFTMPMLEYVESFHMKMFLTFA